MEGTVYLIHFATKLHHAQHYIGWTKATRTIKRRINKHKRGEGSRLMAAVVKAGINFEVVFTKPGTKTDERKMKNCKKSSRFCPKCKELNK